YEPRSESIREQVCQQLTAAELRAWHVRIAGFYAQRGHDVSMLCALHYEYGGEHAEAYTRMKAVDETLHGPDDPNIKLGGSPIGIVLHRAMLDYALASGAPRSEVLQFRRILISIGATSDPSQGAGGPAVVAQLREDIGLDAWDSADPALDEHAKLLFCLGR